MRSGSAAPPQVGQDPEFIAGAIRDFLAAQQNVRIIEDGHCLMRLQADDSGFSLSVGGGKLVCHFWSPSGNIVRRAEIVTANGGDRLSLRCRRLGQSKPSTLTLESPLDYSDAADLVRIEFRQAVVAAAENEWLGWHQHRLPGGSRGPYHRLVFRRDRQLLACTAVDSYESASARSGALAQALIWASHVAEMLPDLVLSGVRLIASLDTFNLVRGRLPWLRAAPPITGFTFDRSAGRLYAIPLSDYANVDSKLRRAIPIGSDFPAAANRLLAEVHTRCPLAALEFAPDGDWRIRALGLEVAREVHRSELSVAAMYGYGREKMPLTADTHRLFMQMLSQIAEQRQPEGNRSQPLWSLQPERWMERVVRLDPAALDPSCDPRFVYTQVPVCLPDQRDVLDLLGVDRSGRLMVIELKADEDAVFPLQALDYWLRVRHHLLQGDFERLGYFPGIRLSDLPPRLILVAPALRWHADSDRALRWISPAVPVERLWINEDWRRGLHVVERSGTTLGTSSAC